MKDLIPSAPYLVLLDFAEASVQLKLHTNVSKYALCGALLTPVYGILIPVAYYSQKYSPIKCNYNTSNRLLLKVVDCLRSF